MTAIATTIAELDQGVVEYRFDRRDGATVVLFHGGHMNAGLALGEDVFRDAGYSALVPSRPGYGRTPLSTGTSNSGFADVTRSVCDHLGVTRIAAAAGISAGGRTAMTMATRHPDLVERVVLQSAGGPASLAGPPNPAGRPGRIRRPGRARHMVGGTRDHAHRTGHRAAAPVRRPVHTPGPAGPERTVR